MAIIDPKGLFHGERLSRCSDAAQLYWHRFFLAANSAGRLEISYDRLCLNALASFKKKPTQREVMSMLAEYAKNHLLFIYNAPDGRLWGQWATAKENLPRYSTRDAAKSPAPDQAAYDAWMNAYIDHKAAQNAEHFKDIMESQSQNSPRITVNHGESHETARGVGVGVGIGVGDGKANTKTTPSAKTAADERHVPIREHIKKCFKTVLGNEQWNGRDGKALNTWLEANPGITAETAIAWVKNRFRSEGLPRGEPAHVWLPYLSSYSEGPLNSYKRVAGATNGLTQVNKAQQRQDERHSDLRAIAESMGVALVRENGKALPGTDDAGRKAGVDRGLVIAAE